MPTYSINDFGEFKPTLRDKFVNFMSGGKLYELEKSKRETISALKPGIPTFDYMPQYTNRSWLAWAYFFEQEVSIFSDLAQKIRDEVFRNGIEWKPNFVLKCGQCEKEYQNTVDQCDRCNSIDLRAPDYSQLQWFSRTDGTTFIDLANLNGQSLCDVLKANDLHITIADNYFLLCLKKYTFNKDGTVQYALPQEFMALDPRDVVMMYDQLGTMGKSGKICLVHRDILVGGRSNEALSSAGMQTETEEAEYASLTQCPLCGKELVEAWYMVQTGTAPARYYGRDEVCHHSFYYPSLLYGYPVALKIQDDLWCYHYIEKRSRSFYETARAPGIMFIPTTNQDALVSTWLSMVEQIKQDPYTIPVIGTSESAPTQANFIRLLEDPNQNLIAVKSELRERISSRFGVTVTFAYDSKQGGNVDSKNLLTVTDRTIAGRQVFHNSTSLKWIAQQYKGIVDFHLECVPHIQENALSKEQLMSMKIQNARGMLEMGFEVKFEDEDFKFSGQPHNLYEGAEETEYDENGNPYKASDDEMDLTAPDRKIEPTKMPAGKRALPSSGKMSSTMQKKKLRDLFR